MSANELDRFSFLDLDDEPAAPAKVSAPAAPVAAPARVVVVAAVAVLPTCSACAQPQTIAMFGGMCDACRRARPRLSTVATVAAPSGAEILGLDSAPAIPSRRAAAAATAATVAPVAARIIDKIFITEKSEFTGKLVILRKFPAVPATSFEAPWTAAGLPAELLPSTCRKSSALTKACESLQNRDRRSTRSRDLDGIFLVDVDRNGVPVLTTGSRFYLDEKGEVQVDGATHAHLLNEVRVAFEARCAEPSDVGQWVRKLIYHFGGVRQGAHDNVFFVRREHSDVVVTIEALIKSVTGVGFSLHDAISSASLIADTAEGLDGEITLLATVIETQILKEMGARGARSRAGEISELEAKIGTYRALLPQHSFDALVSRLAPLRAKLAQYRDRFGELEIE